MSNVKLYNVHEPYRCNVNDLLEYTINTIENEMQLSHVCVKRK